MDSQLFSPPSFPLSSLLLLFPFFFFASIHFSGLSFFFWHSWSSLLTTVPVAQSPAFVHILRDSTLAWIATS